MNEESCLKPIGSLAKLIDSLSTADYIRLMVALSKAEPTRFEGIVVGKND